MRTWLVRHLQRVPIWVFVVVIGLNLGLCFGSACELFGPMFGTPYWRSSCRTVALPGFCDWGCRHMTLLMASSGVVLLSCSLLSARRRGPRA